MKIRTKLVSSFCACIIVMLAILGSIIYLTFEEGIYNDRQEIFSLKAANTAKAFNAAIEKEIDIFGQSHKEAFAGKSKPSLQSGFHRCEGANGIRLFSEVSVISPDGNIRTICSQLPNGKSTTSALQVAARNIAPNTPQFVMLPDGLYLLYPDSNDRSSALLIAAKIEKDELRKLLGSLNEVKDSLLVVSSGSQTFLNLATSKSSQDLVDIYPKEMQQQRIGRKKEQIKLPALIVCDNNVLGLKLTHVVSREFLLHDLVKLKNRIVSAIILIGWMSIWVVLIIAHRLSRPIIKLSKATNDIVTFGNDEKLDFIATGDEVGMLAQNFETMRLKILELIAKDPLTDTYNRRYLMHILEQETARALREHEALSCIMFDMDHFKAINDTYGHPAGDEVLAELGRRLKLHTRIYDTVARFGGEEFVVLSPGIGQDDARSIAERIRVSLENDPMEWQGLKIHNTISAGIASIDEAIVNSTEKLIVCADRALYMAKRSGRNQTVIYEADHDSPGDSA